MFSHHSEQMSQRSQVSRMALRRGSENVFVFVCVFVFVNFFWSCHVFSSLWTNVSKVTSSLGSLCNVKSKSTVSESVTELVTRSPIELFWTAKKREKKNFTMGFMRTKMTGFQTITVLQSCRGNMVNIRGTSWWWWSWWWQSRFLFFIFSCLEQLNRWPCHSLTHSLTEDFTNWHTKSDPRDLWALRHLIRVMTWPTFWQLLKVWNFS